MKSIKLLGILTALGFLAGLSSNISTGQDTPRSPFKVTIQEEKAVVVEGDMPVDPVARIRLNNSGNFMVNIQEEQGRTLQLSHYPTFKVDEQQIFPGNNPGARFEVNNAPLPKTAGGKVRSGYMNVYTDGDIRYTQTAEIVPTKSTGKGQKRRMDSVMIRYTIENKGKAPHKVGMRIYLDTYVIDNDGCLFAAPTMPGKILNGIELKDKMLPDYLQMLQRPDLKNPGFVAHLTLNLGASFEKPNLLMLTHHGSAIDQWQMRCAESQGDSALGIFWDPKEIKPGGKRELAYAHGQGIAVAPESEGRFQVQLGGSFEPGKLFTVSAQINDPAPGQTLTLELPKGMQSMEGKEIQPVPDVMGERSHSIVLWKARVMEPGAYPIRIRSSTGVTQTKLVTISKAAD